MAALSEVTALLEHHHQGALATMENGAPFVSAVGFIFIRHAAGLKTGDKTYFLEGSLYMLLSGLARHTRNLERNSAASLLVLEENAAKSLFERKRVSIQGEVHRLNDQTNDEKIKQRYLEVFPQAKIFFTLPDFRFYRLDPSEAYWIGGFAQAEVFK